MNARLFSSNHKLQFEEQSFNDFFIFDTKKVGEDQAAAVEDGLVPVENQTVEVRVVLGLEVRRLIPIRSHLILNNNILTRVVKGMYVFDKFM